MPRRPGRHYPVPTPKLKGFGAVVAARLHGKGRHEVSLGDTIGVGAGTGVAPGDMVAGIGEVLQRAPQSRVTRVMRCAAHTARAGGS